MTASKTALDKAIETVWTWPQAARLLHGGIYDELVERVAQFADSLAQEATAELQKENARLEKLVGWTAEVLLQHMNDEDYEASIAGIYAKLTEAALNPPTGGEVQKGLSKEKAK